MKNFFISYTQADQTWAEWVAWQLEEAGYSVIIQAWDFKPGRNFVAKMDKATIEAERTILILSSDYLASRFTLPEWASAFAEDPTGEKGRLVPVRVAECSPKGLLPQIVYVDLVGKPENDAKQLLLRGVSRNRAKPVVAPKFPAQPSPGEERRPWFPGQQHRMPGLDTHIELLRSENILGEVPDLLPEIVAGVKEASFGVLLVDNSSVDYAFEVLSGSVATASKILPRKKWIFANAVVELISALVLHDKLIVGPSPARSSYTRDDLRKVSELLQHADEMLPPKQMFGILSMARLRSMNMLRADEEIIRTLDRVLERKLDRDLVYRYIGSMTPNASDHSPHFWERLFEKGKSEYYFQDLSYGILGANTVAMNAVDDSNAQKLWSQSDYWAEFCKRDGGMTFPDKTSIHEFYAGSLIFRTFVYLYLSELLACTYRGDALRAEIATTVLASQRRRSFSDVVLDALAIEEKKKDQVVNGILGFDTFELSVPLVAQAVLHKARTLEDVLPLALDLRESDAAKKFRQFSSTVDKAIASGNRREVEQAIQELQSFGLDLAAHTNLPPGEYMSQPQKLVRYGSSLLTNVMELVAAPIEGLLEKVQFRKLAFLNQLRSVPRTAGPLAAFLD